MKGHALNERCSCKRCENQRLRQTGTWGRIDHPGTEEDDTRVIAAIRLLFLRYGIIEDPDRASGRKPQYDHPGDVDYLSPAVASWRPCETDWKRLALAMAVTNEEPGFELVPMMTDEERKSGKAGGSLGKQHIKWVNDIDLSEMLSHDSTLSKIAAANLVTEKDGYEGPSAESVAKHGKVTAEVDIAAEKALHPWRIYWRRANAIWQRLEDLANGFTADRPPAIPLDPIRGPKPPYLCKPDK